MPCHESASGMEELLTDQFDMISAQRQIRRKERNMKAFVEKAFLGFLMAAMLFIVGCGEKKCYFVTRDGEGLKAGDRVVWYDACAGKVDSVDSDGDSFKIEIKFNKKYGALIHDGVGARIVNDPKISSKPFVLLVGGRDANRPLLEAGAEIPESKQGSAVAEGFSSFVDWLKNCRAEELKVIGAALLILFALLKFVSKTFKFILFLGIVGAIGYVCVTANIDWSRYKDRVANVKVTAQEAKEWVQKHGEKLHTILETALEDD